MCVPRPDSPSVFSAMLDRSAGSFRVSARTTSRPRRPALPPGQPDARDDVADADRLARRPRGPASMGPWHNVDDRSRTHRRSPTDFDAEHCLIRTVRCVSGTVDLAMSCEPVFDYGSVAPDLEVRRRRLRRAGSPAATATDPAADHRPALRHRGSGVRARTRMVEGETALRRAVLVAAAAPPTWDEAAERMDRTAEYWRQWITARRVPRPPVAALPPGERAHPQGTDLRPDRRAAAPPPRRRCPRRRTASATGTTATPGSATRRSRCGASTPSASTARPTTSSTSSPTAVATARTCRSCTASAVSASSRSRRCRT